MNSRGCFFKHFISFICCLPVLLVMFAFPGVANSQQGAAAGRQVYEKYCVGCHGEKGDGKGIAAKDLLVKPRDFTLGIFKFKSTPPGSLPTDDDLKKTITNGIKTSSMPNFRLLPDADKEKLIAFIKGMSDRWNKEKPGKKFAQVIVPDFVGKADSIKKGKDLFAVRCQMCHGTAQGVPDVMFSLKWSNKECNDVVRPANFNYGVIKRGPKVEDIFMSITAGVEGTPMLSFADMLSETDRWHLTSYVLSMMGKRGGN